MNYIISHTIEDFKQLQGKWEDLYNQLPNLSQFQSYHFNYYSWEYLLKKDGNLFLISFYENDQLVTIFPTYIDKYKTLRFINDIHADFCNILNISISIFKVFKIFEKIVHSYNQIKEIRFNNLNDISTASQLNYHFKKRKSLDSCIQHSFLNITNYLFSHLNSSERSGLKRIEKKFKDYSYHEWNSFDIHSIDLIRNSMIKNGLRNKSFLSPSFMKLLKKLFEIKKIRIFSLDFNEKVMALSIVISRESKQLIWIDLYDVDIPYINLGNYIFFLKKAQKNKDLIVDFGRGTYNYKIQNFKPSIKNIYSFSYSKNLFFFTKRKIMMLLKAILKSIFKEKQY